MKTIAASVVFVVFVLSLAAHAQIPRTISYQGVLTDSLGNPKPNGAYSMTFRLYASVTGGLPLWSETKSLQVTRGLFSTAFGDVTPFPLSLSFSSQYWLTVQVASGVESTPRMSLTAVPYSISASKADSATAVSANAVTTTSIADNAVTSAKIQNGTIQFQDIAPNGAASGQVMKWNGSAWAAGNDSTGTGGGGPWQYNGSDIFFNTGRVGIGRNTPNAALHVMGSAGETNVFRVDAPFTNGKVASFGGSGRFEIDAFSTPGGRLTVTDAGNVGIGTSTPNTPLAFPNVLGKKITLYPGPTGDAGLGVFGNELRINSDYSGADITFGFDDYTSGFAERMRIKGNGNVGIGTGAPNAPLSFAQSLGKKITLYPGPSGDVGFGVAGNRLQIFSDNPNADVAIGYDAAGTFNERFAVKPNGALAVNGNVGAAGQVLQSNGGGGAAQWQSMGSVIQTYFNNTYQSSPLLTSTNRDFVFSHFYTITVTRNSRLVISGNFETSSNFCLACSASEDAIILRVNGAETREFTLQNTPNGLMLGYTISNFMYDVSPGVYTVDFLIHHTMSAHTDAWGVIHSSSIIVFPQ